MGPRPPPLGLENWRNRHHVHLGVGFETALLAFDTGETQHRFGPSLDLSYRYRQDEVLAYTYDPAFFEAASLQQRQDVLDGCERAAQLHCFQYEDGAGPAADGQYATVTALAIAHDVGVVGAVHYQMRIEQVELGVDAGLARYLRQARKGAGTHTRFWGFSVGYRF